MAKGGLKGRPEPDDGSGGDGGGDGGGVQVADTWIFLGDSLTDNGLFHDLSSDFLSVTAPFQTDGTDYSDSFTNGIVYADTWMKLNGTAEADYINLALGGAEATGVKKVSSYINKYSNLTASNGQTFSIVETETPQVNDPGSVYDGALLAGWDINLAGQTARYLEYYEDDPNSFTTASIFIGANDLAKFEFNIFDYLLFGQVDRFARDIADAIEDSARLLVADGVDRIVLNTMPIARLFYAWDQADPLERDIGDDLVNSTTSAILDAANRLRADGIEVEVIRIDRISYELNYDQETFGFGTVEPYLLGYGGDPVWHETSPGVFEPSFTLNPDRGDWRMDQRLFYDEIHPTEAMHDVLAVFSHESLTSNVIFGNNSGNNLRGSGSDDLIMGRDGVDQIDGRAGNDVILAGRGSDTVEGGTGSDLVIGGSGNDTLRGGDQADLLAGGPGTDWMEGGKGNDLLIGGHDGDTMLGNAGADIFLFIEDDLTADNDTNGGSVDGGGGNDTLWLVLTPETAALLGETPSTADLASLDLTVSSVEEVVVFSYTEFEEFKLAAALPDSDLDARLVEGDLWGVA